MDFNYEKTSEYFKTINYDSDQPLAVRGVSLGDAKEDVLNNEVWEVTDEGYFLSIRRFTATEDLWKFKYFLTAEGNVEEWEVFLEYSLSNNENEEPFNSLIQELTTFYTMSFGKPTKKKKKTNPFYGEELTYEWRTLIDGKEKYITVLVYFTDKPGFTTKVLKMMIS